MDYYRLKTIIFISGVLIKITGSLIRACDYLDKQFKKRI
jgi:hypothetical protein